MTVKSDQTTGKEHMSRMHGGMNQNRLQSHPKDTFVIRIPDTTISIKKDDYLVKGICDIDMTTAKDLKGTECCKVTSANYNTFGANPHIKVGGV